MSPSTVRLGPALVTGAGSGIGRALAVTLAEYAQSIVLVGRTIPGLNETAAQIVQRGGVGTVLACDLADPHQRSSLPKRVHELVGPLSCLVHCAAIFDPACFNLMPASAIDRVLQTNLAAPIDLTRQFMPDILLGGISVAYLGSLAILEHRFLQSGMPLGAYPLALLFLFIAPLQITWSTTIARPLVHWRGQLLHIAKGGAYSPVMASAVTDRSGRDRSAHGVKSPRKVKS